MLPLLAERGPARRSPSTSRDSASPTGPRTSTTAGRASRRWIGEALDALELERCHLVVHDIGGPIGLRVGGPQPGARPLADRAQHGARRRRPSAACGAWRPFRRRGSARSGWRPSAAPAFAALFYLQGIADRYAVPRARDLAHHRPPAPRRPRPRLPADHARLRAHRGEAALLSRGLRERPYPAQVIWGERDPALGRDRRPASRSVPSASRRGCSPPSTFFRRTRRPCLAVADWPARLRSRSGGHARRTGSAAAGAVARRAALGGSGLGSAPPRASRAPSSRAVRQARRRARKRNLDQVEVARRDRVRELLPRLARAPRRRCSGRRRGRGPASRPPPRRRARPRRARSSVPSRRPARTPRREAAVVDEELARRERRAGSSRRARCLR